MWVSKGCFWVSLSTIPESFLSVCSTAFFSWLQYLRCCCNAWLYVNSQGRKKGGKGGTISCFSIFLKFNYFNWRLITLQYCSGFCHTLTWIRHECTCVPHSEPPSHYPPHPIPQGHPSGLALSSLSHALNWIGDLFYIW